MLLAWGLTLLPPLLDALTSRAHEAQIGYLILGERPWLGTLLRFFDPAHPLEGTTPGIRIEAALACLLGAGYVWLRAPGQRVLRALGTAAAVYLTSFSFFTMPSLYQRAVSLVLPGVSYRSLLIGVGRVSRPAIEVVRFDQAILLYLIPLTLLLGALALARTRPEMLPRIAALSAASEGPAWAIVCALGTAAGWTILDSVAQPAASAPFDALSRVAACAALGLAGCGLALVTPTPERTARDGMQERVAGAVILAAAALLAGACSLDVAASCTMALGAGLLARAIPAVLPRAALAPQAASGIATLAAFLAGWSLAAGSDALVVLPAAMLVAMVVAGMLADLLRAADLGRRYLGPLLRAGAAAVPLLAAALPTLAIGAGPSAAAIGAAVFFSASVLAASMALPPRTAGALALTGAAAALGLSVADPGQAGLWRAKALSAPSYFMRLSEQAEAKGDLQRAAGAAQEAIRRAPNLAATHQRLAAVRMKSGDVTGVRRRRPRRPVGQAFRGAPPFRPRARARPGPAHGLHEPSALPRRARPRRAGRRRMGRVSRARRFSPGGSRLDRAGEAPARLASPSPVSLSLPTSLRSRHLTRPVFDRASRCSAIGAYATPHRSPSGTRSDPQRECLRPRQSRSSHG